MVNLSTLVMVPRWTTFRLRQVPFAPTERSEGSEGGKKKREKVDRHRKPPNGGTRGHVSLHRYGPCRQAQTAACRWSRDREEVSRRDACGRGKGIGGAQQPRPPVASSSF